jgi:hypothetical protein
LKTQLLLALVFVLVVVPCTFKYAVPVFWQLYFSGVEVKVCGLVVDKKESECFVHLPRSIFHTVSELMFVQVSSASVCIQTRMASTCVRDHVLFVAVRVSSECPVSPHPRASRWVPVWFVLQRIEC